VHGQHEHAKLRLAREQLPAGARAIQAGHGQIGEHYVRTFGVDQREQFGAVAGLADQLVG
jgi:hypothetical protein